MVTNKSTLTNKCRGPLSAEGCRSEEFRPWKGLLFLGADYVGPRGRVVTDVCGRRKVPCRMFCRRSMKTFAFICMLAHCAAFSNHCHLLSKRFRVPKICSFRKSTIAKMEYETRKISESPEVQQDLQTLSRRSAILLSAASLITPSLAHSEEKQTSIPDEYWDNLLKEGKISKMAYKVLHRSATEKPFTSPLLSEKRKGIFACAA